MEIKGDATVARNTSTKSLRVDANTVTVSAATQSLNAFASSQQIYIGTTAGQIVKFPDATTLIKGYIFEFHNNSETTITVQDNGANELFKLFPNERVYSTLQDASTINGVWSAKFEYKKFQNSINTTNGTVTTAQTLTVPADCVMLIETTVTARRTGGTGGSAGDCATYVRQARVKDVASTTSIHNVDAIYTSEDQTGWNATIDVSVNTARIRVDAANNNNVTWNIETTVRMLR